MRITAILGLCVCLHATTGAVGSKVSRRKSRWWKWASGDFKARHKVEVLESRPDLDWGKTWRKRRAGRYRPDEDKEARDKTISSFSKSTVDNADMQTELEHLRSENRQLQEEIRQLQEDYRSCRDMRDRAVAWQRAELEAQQGACLAAAKAKEEACMEIVDRLRAGAAAEYNETSKEEDSGVKSECRGPGLVELLMLFMGYKFITMFSDKDSGQVKEATLVNEEQTAPAAPDAVPISQDEEDEEMPEAPREEEPVTLTALLQGEEPEEEEEEEEDKEEEEEAEDEEEAPSPPEAPEMVPHDATAEEDAQATATSPDADEDQNDDGDRSVMSDESFELVP